MKKMFILTFLFLSTISLFSQDKSDFKVTGYVFGDYFYKAGGDTNKTGGYKSQYYGNTLITPNQQYGKSFSGFQIRRLYLGVYYNLNDAFATTVLFEGNDKTFGGSQSSNLNKQGIYVKQAFVEWKNLVPNASLYLGLVPTPTFSTDEAILNYRSVEKTPGDARGLGNASDFGVTLKGKFDNDGMITYHATIGNGSGQGYETNKYKVFYGSIDCKPVKDLIVELYGDYAPSSNGVVDKNVTSLKAIAGYKIAGLSLGAEYFTQTKQNGTEVFSIATPKVIGYTDITTNVFSVFGHYALTSNLNVLARFDSYDPDTKATADAIDILTPEMTKKVTVKPFPSLYKEKFVTVGLDYAPTANVHIIPNIWSNSFSAKGTTPSKDADLVYRITYHFIFK